MHFWQNTYKTKQLIINQPEILLEKIYIITLFDIVNTIFFIEYRMIIKMRKSREKHIHVNNNE